MARKLQTDRWLFVATLALVCVSVVMVYSASALMASERYGQQYYFLQRQLMWAAMGVGVLYAVMRIDYRSYRSDLVVWSMLGLVGTLLVAVLFFDPVNGTRRWFGIGGFGVQPSELAKLSAILFTALTLERQMHRVNDPRAVLVPVLTTVGVLVALIMLEPDFGTAVAVLGIVSAMIFAAGLSYKYIVGLAAVALPVLYVALMSAPYRRRRLFAFIDPWKDPLGDGFQIIQSLIAVGTGGLTGRGLMDGVQKLFFLPEPQTDFIYAVISEELGFVGALLVLVCFCLIGWRGMRAALRAPDSFGAFLALGLTLMIVLQALVNISVVLGLLPTKGIPLPLVSQGGSSLLVNLFGIGVLLNISQHGVGETGAA